MAHIGLFLPRLDDGGAEHVMLKLGDSFAARGHRVDLVVAVPGGPLLSKVPASVRFIDLKARRSAMAVPSLVRYLRSERPSALLSTLEHSNIMAVLTGLLSRTGVRVVLREASVLLPWDRKQGAKIGIQKALMSVFYRGSAQVVAVSKAVEDSLVANLKLPPRLVRTIYNPMVTHDLDRLAAAPVDDDPWFAPGAPPVVLGVGRLNACKNFELLLKAFATVRARRPAHLLILGEGNERGALESLARQLDITEDVRLPGFEQNPLRFMSRAQVFVLPSMFEGLPGALIQAMACGCRVISTDCPGGCREILEGGAPDHGRLVPMSDPPAMVAAIDAMLDAALRGPGRVRHDVARFTESTTVDQYLDVLGVGAEPTNASVSPPFGAQAGTS